MMDLGKICGVTFADAVGAFVLGMVIGALFTVLLTAYFRKEPHP